MTWIDHTARRLAALRAEKKARLRREHGIELCESCGEILREEAPRVACEDCSLCLACGADATTEVAALSVARWLVRIGGQCRHPEVIRTVSGDEICVTCDDSIKELESR